MATSITDTLSGYKNVCSNAEFDDNIFYNFKQIEEYKQVVSTVHAGSEKYIEYMTNSPISNEKFIDDMIAAAKANDKIGNQDLYDYGPKWGVLSPTSLAYGKIITELVEIFGNLDGKSIVEIGAGYGGLCLMISKMFKVKSYTIIDIKEALKLSKRYLTESGVDNLVFVENNAQLSEENYDLLISNYAFSECAHDQQMFYIENVLKKCKNGFMEYNNIGHMFSIRSLNPSEFKSIMNCMEKEEIPPSGFDNKLFYW